MSLEAAEQSLKDGDIQGALKMLQDEIRTHAADPKLRVFLFQLLCLTGQWERALAQLDVAATLDAGALAMAQMYGQAVRCEPLRAQVFEGRKSPMVLGQPEQWLALLIEALLVSGQGRFQDADSLRGRAFEAADATSGTMDGEAFAWIADADSRLGPVCEAIINGRYYWVPFSRLRRVVIDAPEDLRDLVWMPAHFEFDDGGDTVALIPTRYPGSETSENAQIVLARTTVWTEKSAGVYHGLGQRLITTDSGEKALMDIREILLNVAPTEGLRQMAELSPQERLQPALLDRLIDDEPRKTVEPRENRVLSKAALRRAVLRDLAWLFNTTRLEHHSEFAAYPEAEKSVINFGLPALSGETASTFNPVALEQSIKRAIVDFEPRISAASLQVETQTGSSELDSHNLILVQIRGSLWAQPVPLEFLLRTEVDLETGSVEIQDLARAA